MKKLMVVILMSLFAWGINTARAQKPGIVLNNSPGWKKIGETVASFKTQNESIAVIGADEFAAIKLKVEDAPLSIDRLQVFYESGDMQEIDVKKHIGSGGESEVFTLEKPGRDIQKVAFTYHTEPNAKGEKAEVELFGFKTEASGKESKTYRDRADKTEDAIEEKSEKAGDDIERGARKTKRDVQRAADKTGDAISEGAARSAAEITDKKLDSKMGPDGQTIYIDDDSKYYYINDKGKKVYVSSVQLKDKG
jgi:hypothetical protein